MWAFTSILCLTAVSAEFTMSSLEEMSTSIKSFADTLASKVANQTTELSSMTVQITQLPMKIAAAQLQGGDSLATAKKGAEALEAKMCKAVIELSTTTSEAEKKSQEMNDKVSTIQGQLTNMTKDPSKEQDTQKMAAYSLKIQQAIRSMESAAASAKTLMPPTMVQSCKDKTYETSFTRLFLATQPTVGRSSFHVPSVVLGAVVGAAVMGAMVFSAYRAKGSKTEVALMEEGSLE